MLLGPLGLGLGGIQGGLGALLGGIAPNLASGMLYFYPSVYLNRIPVSISITSTAPSQPIVAPQQPLTGGKPPKTYKYGIIGFLKLMVFSL